MKYDFAGRLVFNQFNREYGSTGKRIYEQAIQYDAFLQMTSRQITYWDNDGGGFTASYVNGRKQDSTLSFDASGNITAENHATNEFQNMYFDASGRRTGHLERWHTNNGPQSTFIAWENKTEEVFDGDGRPVIEKKGMRQMNQTTVPPMTTSPYLFQVWSSVLGSSLTTVTPDGNKFETKVFAGGAVIAKQKRFVGNNQNYDSIEWTTADPVTGTVGKFSYTAEGSVRIKEEIEPLGQKISGTDPDPSAEVTYQMRLFGADDAEWQCEISEAFYGGFQGMPDHCQMKILQDFSRGLDEIYGFSNKTRESNPGNVTVEYNGIDSPNDVPDIPFEELPVSKMPTNVAFSKSLQSTAKPKTKDKPKVDVGKVGSVEIKAEDQPIDFNNFENGGDDRILYPDDPSIKKRKMTEAEVSDLRRNVNAMLDANDGQCKRYIEKLLDKAQELHPNGEIGNITKSDFVLKTHMVMSIFDTVNEQGGFYFAYGNTVNMFQNQPRFGGAIVWLVGDNGIEPGTRSQNPVWQRQSAALDSLLTVRAIHELIHYNFSDNQLARAAAALQGDKNTDFSGFFGPSNYWDGQLRRNCDPYYVPPKK
jgi:YD repeat-containing protein